MDLPFVIAAAAVLIVLFMIIGSWERHLARKEKEEVLAHIGDAKERGTSKPLTQYPQIKPYLCIGCGSCIKACPEDEVIGLVNGIATIVHGSRCIGAAECEAACPVNAITVGLGDVRSRPDIPILTPEMETTIPNVYIAGELGGLSLIKKAIDQGAQAVTTIAKKLKARPIPGTPDVLDVLIVGSGPAGMSATLKCIELKLTHATICQDDVGGTVKKYPRRKLTLVQTVELPLYGKMPGREYTKEEIIAIWDRLIKKHNIQIATHTALTMVKREGGLLHITTSKGNFKARTVILALGRRGTPRKLGVPGEDQEKVLYQLMDAATYNRLHLLVVGGGDSAVEAALALAKQTGNTVTLSYRKENFVRLKSTNERRIAEYTANGKINVLMASEVEAIGAKTVKLTLKSAMQTKRVEIPNDFVFIYAGGDPPYPLLQSLGIQFGGNPAQKQELAKKNAA
jgi:thioredoxin reductase (NADPH)